VIIWEHRPRLVAHFLNPALMAVVIATSASDYERVREEAMPWMYAFIAAPLILHGPTRRALPRDTRTHLATWVARNPTIVAGFPDRARGLVPCVREGLRYGLRSGVVVVTGQEVHSELSQPRGAVSGQLAELIRAAGLIGRWVAKLDQPATAYALLGVAP